MVPDGYEPAPGHERGRHRVAAALETAGSLIDDGRRRAASTLETLESRRGRSPVLDVMFRAVERDRRIHAGMLAAALAFRLFLFLLPVTLVIIVLLGFVIDSDPGSSRDLVDRFGLRGALADALLEATNQGRPNRWWALAVGLAGTVWATLGCVRGIRLAYFLAWERLPTPLRKPHVAVGGFLGGYLALLGAPLLAGWARAVFGLFGDIVGALGVLLIYMALWTAVVWFLPHSVEHWRYLFPGALMLAIGAEAIQLVTAYFFTPRLEHSASVYGVVGVAAVLLTWLFLIARLAIAAAVLNAVLEQRRMRVRERRADHAGATPPTAE